MFSDCQMLIWEERSSFWLSSVILLNFLPTIFTWSTVIGLLVRHYQRLRETARNDNPTPHVRLELGYTILSYVHVITRRSFDCYRGWTHLDHNSSGRRLAVTVFRSLEHPVCKLAVADYYRLVNSIYGQWCGEIERSKIKT